MSILINKKFNVFLMEIISILLILVASLIPWLEFINSNYKEMDEIFNDNFFFLICLYFLFVTFIYFLTKILFKNRVKFYYISLVSISIWIFFQHNLLKSILNTLFSKTNIWHYSSEIAFFIIITLIIALTIILNRDKNWRSFVLFFLIFNFVYSSINLFPKLKIFKINNEKINLIKSDQIQPSSNGINESNIYFFIIDSMKPLNEFENFYNTKLKVFRNLYKQYGYTYYENTTNLYMWTEPVLTSMFYLEENIYDTNLENNDFVNWTETNLNKKLKKNINKTFPTFLKNDYNPKLLMELNKLGYKFKWVGNYAQNCSYTNYRYCLKDQKKNYIDLYTLQAFVSKSPILQILDKLIQLEFISDLVDVKILHSDAIFELNKFIVSNKDYMNEISPTFFLIHDMETHEPYFVDSNCDNKRLPGKYNLEGYKNSYLCVIKKITNVIKTLEEFDPNSVVIFQSDHSWIMSEKSEKNYGNRNNIFNLIKDNANCNKQLPENPNATNLANYLINCRKS